MPAAGPVLKTALPRPLPGAPTRSQDGASRKPAPDEAAAEPAQRLRWSAPAGPASALAIALAARRHPGLTVVLTGDPAEAMTLEGELAFFLGHGRDGGSAGGAAGEPLGQPAQADVPLPVRHFPDRETLPYDLFSPPQDITSERLATLAELPTLTRGVLLLPVRTAMHRLAPPEFVHGRVLHLRKGDRFDPVEQRRRLQRAGYRAADTVMEPGEFAVRGAVMDIFPMGSPHPFRIDLFDDEIDTLRRFDPETQRSAEEIREIRLLPGREVPIDDAGVSTFRQRWHESFDVDVRRCPVYQDVSEGLAPAGVEYYLPLFFPRLATLFDYLPDNVLFVVLGNAPQSAEHFAQEAGERYEEHRHDTHRPLCPPASLFLPAAELFTSLAAWPRIDLQHPAAPVAGAQGAGEADDDPRHAALAARAVPDVELNSRAPDPGRRLRDTLASLPGAVLFTADSAGRREIVADLLRQCGVQTEPVADWQQFLDRAAGKPGLRAIAVAPLTQALHLADVPCTLIPESALHGQKVTAERRRARSVDPDLVLRSLTELSIGAPVVHLEHGVGRYQGLQMLEVDGQRLELLVLEYADEARLYVPVSSLHLISRYAGADAEHAPLHRLGSDQWEKARRKAAEKARDVAAELLDIYARREARPGFAYPAPALDYRRFCAGFAFEETPDQEAAIEAVVADMMSPRPMDRLICGDVGFGKTEVAMRAAFIAVQAGKQVAILVPTTLLAQQHYDNFCDRFAEWAVKIELVSRVRTEGEVEAASRRMESGGVDIVIGTHKILGREFRFAQLGLVIIDEEHRFGVRHKEQLKALRADVDVLTLTATPIPRTLNMAVSGIRDMSIIATPPARRLAVKTFVREFSPMLVHEAIVRELARGGQVFYLHNEVKTIAQTADGIAQRIPESRVAIGHGQMRSHELERVMTDFHHRRTNVLVCTTIIETGIDIPNANTIIIDRADKFGLAQLHQLRGRVGRSHRQAYAYLMTPPAKAMTTDASKRLEAIEAAGDLGIGFTLATHDLEIRGAGELLGDDQSGQIEGVGFSLYMDMLHRAVEAIRAGRTPNIDEPLESGIEVNLRLPALIPDEYLPDVHARLILYKRIASATNDEELDNLRAEIHDRFGALPTQALLLFRITALKLAGNRLAVRRIDFGVDGGAIEFLPATQVSPMTLVQMVQAEPKRYRLDAGGQRLRVLESDADPDRRIALVAALLQRLENPPALAPGRAAPTPAPQGRPRFGQRPHRR
jgi:transcription-repair coupling factor (superfamily II helicase)